MNNDRTAVLRLVLFVATLVVAASPEPATAYIKVDTPFISVYDQTTELYIARVKSIDSPPYQKGAVSDK